MKERSIWGTFFMKRHMELLMGILLLLAVFAFTGPFPVWEMAGKQTNGIPVENGREQEAKDRGEIGESGNSRASQTVVVLDAGHGGCR